MVGRFCKKFGIAMQAKNDILFLFANLAFLRKQSRHTLTPNS